MNYIHCFIKPFASVVLLLLLNAFSLCAQTTSEEDLVYIQQAQYQQEMSYKQGEGPYSSITGTVSQHGEGHKAVLEQYGNDLKASIMQRGSNNNLSLRQEGSFLEANISQEGDFLNQKLVQEGNNNLLNISQYGSLSGTEQPFSYTQSGEGLNLEIIMEGNAPPVEVTQSN